MKTVMQSVAVVPTTSFNNLYFSFKSCYGIRRVPRGKWYCKPCSENVKPECVLCPNTGGAMTKTRYLKT